MGRKRPVKHTVHTRHPRYNVPQYPRGSGERLTRRQRISEDRKSYAQSLASTRKKERELKDEPWNLAGFYLGVLASTDDPRLRKYIKPKYEKIKNIKPPKITKKMIYKKATVNTITRKTLNYWISIYGYNQESYDYLNKKGVLFSDSSIAGLVVNEKKAYNEYPQIIGATNVVIGKEVELVDLWKESSWAIGDSWIDSDQLIEGINAMSRGKRQDFVLKASKIADQPVVLQNQKGERMIIAPMLGLPDDVIYGDNKAKAENKGKMSQINDVKVLR